MKRRVTARPVSMPCGHCAGTGCVPLPAHLLATLAEVMLCVNGATAPFIAKQLGMRQPTAVNNRLAVLLALGLVTRERNGKPYVWRAP